MNSDIDNAKGPSYARRLFQLIKGLFYHRKVGFMLFNRNLYLLRVKELRKKPKLGVKPVPVYFDSVEITPFRYDCTAALCLSADFELAWAWMHAKFDEKKQAETARRNFPKIIETLEKYNIPVTWATIGHLFLESCKRDKGGLAHPDLPRPKKFYKNIAWSWHEGDWFQYDPCTNVKKDPQWYAPDIISEILESTTKHEFGTHTFSHMDFSDKNCDEELARADIRKCAEVMKNFDLKPRSLVFPVNFEGNFKAIAEEGIIAYRGFVSMDISYPIKNEYGSWNIPQGVFLFWGEEPDWLGKAKRYIQAALDKNMVCHIGFHPTDIDKERLGSVFVPLLDLVDKMRKRRKLWIATMSDLASYTEAREKINVETRMEKNEMILTMTNKMDMKKYDVTDITLKIKIPKSKSIRSVTADGKTMKLNSTNCFLMGDLQEYLVVTVPSSTKEIGIRTK